MSPERDVTPIVRSWLEVGPTALPDRVLDSVLDSLPATPQRRPPWRTRRLNLMSSPVRIAVAAAVIAVFAVIGINVLPRGGDGIGTDVPSPSLRPGPSASVATTPSLESPDAVKAYVRSAYENLVDLPALTLTVVEQEGTKGRYMYNGAGLLHHDHFGNATDDQPASYRIFSRDTMAEMSDLDGEPVWLEYSGQGNPLSELAGAAGLLTDCDGSWVYVGAETIIGRPTRHVDCGGSGMWLDDETLLPLRSAQVHSEGWVTRKDVIELQVGPQPADLFQPPAGVRVVSDREYECASDPVCESPVPEGTERPVITPGPAAVDLAAPADLDAFVAEVLATYAAPPALEMVVDSGHLTRYLSDGAGQSLEADGSVPAGATLPWYLRSDGHTYERFGGDDGPVSWQDQGPSEWGGIPDLGLGQGCDTGWEHHGSDLVLDRPTHHLVCDYDEYWVDPEWTLVMRHQRNPDPLGYETDVEEVTELRFGALPAELFQLPADACVSSASRARDCVPLASGSPDPATAGTGPALSWTEVAQGGTAVAWLGDHFVLAGAAGDPISTSRDGITWQPADPDTTDSAYADVLRGSGRTATWGDGMVGWDPESSQVVRVARSPGGAQTKDDFAGTVATAGIGPRGVVARVHSGIDFDAFVTGFLGADWVGQIKEFEFADGVLHIATDDGRSADIVMADHGLGPGDVADRGYGWFSVDGVDWSVIPDFPSNVTDIVGVADGFIARGESMWHSPDGLTWNEIGPYAEGTMIGWQDGALMFDPSGGLDLWTAQGSSTLALAPEFPSGSLTPDTVGTGPLGMVSVGTKDVLFTSNGKDWSRRAMPEAMYATGGGRRPPAIAVGDDAVLVLMWSAGESPVPTLWWGTPES